MWWCGGVDTPATGTATASAITDTTATLDYTIAVNNDNTVGIKVFEDDGSGGYTGAPIYQSSATDIDVTDGNVDLTGMTAETTYNVYLTSSLLGMGAIDSANILTSFTTEAELVKRVSSDMKVTELKEYAKENNITLSGARNKTDIINAINSAE